MTLPDSTPSSEPDPPGGGPGTNLLVRQIRKVLAALLGTTVLLIGAAMLVLPGPGILALIFGLTILAVEFAWARSLLKRIREEGIRAISERWRRFFGVQDEPAR